MNNKITRTTKKPKKKFCMLNNIINETPFLITYKTLDIKFFKKKRVTKKTKTLNMNNKLV